MFSFLWRQSVYWHDKNGVHMMMRHGYGSHVVVRRDKDLREHCHSRMLKTITASLHSRTSRGCRH